MLPQKTVPRWRKIKLRKFVILSGLPFLCVIAAFGIVPQTMTAPEGERMQVEEITLPRIAPAGNIPAFWSYGHVQGGDNAAKILQRLNVEDGTASNFMRTARAAISFRKLAAGRAVEAETGIDGRLLSLRYMDNAGSQLAVERTGSGFSVRTLPAQLESRIIMRTGEIRTTLFEATDQAGLPEATARQLPEIFGSEIDFHHDLHMGDSFSVIYEAFYSNGELVRVGRILAAEFINSDKPYRALYFQNGKNGDYYTPEGFSVRRTFLLSPVEFTRISSGYTASRFHPILHKWGAHKGIDFAAPMGTRVKATAEGTVAFVGAQRGYGKIVVIKHMGRYSTAYGHLSRFASSLHTGQHVAQGEVIGYVGKTGLATGPHLHYEFRVDEQPRNPLNYAPRETPSINNEQRNAFLEATRELSARLGILHNIILAQTS